MQVTVWRFFQLNLTLPLLSPFPEANIGAGVRVKGVSVELSPETWMLISLNELQGIINSC